MPSPNDTFYNIKRLHVLFAISAVLRLASVGLLRFIREPRRSLRSAGGDALEDSLPRPGAPED